MILDKANGINSVGKLSPRLLAITHSISSIVSSGISMPVATIFKTMLFSVYQDQL